MPPRFQFFARSRKENKENSAAQQPADNITNQPLKPALQQQQQPPSSAAAPAAEPEPAPLQQLPAQPRAEPLRAKPRKPRPAAAPSGDIGLLSPSRGPTASAQPNRAKVSMEERVVLEDWSFAFNASRPLQLTGKVNNCAGYDDGDTLEYTSQIVSINGRAAMTKSGTVYQLGQPASSFDQLRVQLWINSRTGAMGRDDGSSVPPLDVDNPLLGIKLGAVIATSPVRLPRVPGWSHQSGVALLHEWSAVKNGNGFVHVVGTVFNCPGAYDGAEGHTTAAVVDVRGRMLVTVEGAEFYLGFRAGSDAEERKALVAHEIDNYEIGLLGLSGDSILAV